MERAKNARGWSETVWGEAKETRPVEAGTSSGCSAYEPKPAWQTDTGCAKRTDNDVAAVGSTATPVWIADSYEDAKNIGGPGKTPAGHSRPGRAGQPAGCREHGAGKRIHEIAPGCRGAL